MLFLSDWLGAWLKAHYAYRIDKKHGCKGDAKWNRHTEFLSWLYADILYGSEALFRHGGYSVLINGNIHHTQYLAPGEREVVMELKSHDVNDE